MAEIGRAYRKKSMLLQCVSTLRLFVPIFLRARCLRKSPDKNPGVKGAQDRFARLGVVGSILRNQEGRERSVPRDTLAVAAKQADNLCIKIRFLLQKWGTTLAWNWILLFSLPSGSRGARSFLPLAMSTC